MYLPSSHLSCVCVGWLVAYCAVSVLRLVYVESVGRGGGDLIGRSFFKQDISQSIVLTSLIWQFFMHVIANHVLCTYRKHTKAFF